MDGGAVNDIRDDVGKRDVIFLKNFFPGDGFVMVGVI